MIRSLCSIIILMATAMAGCSSGIISMGHGMYRIKNPDSIQGSRLMRQTCPHGYEVMNPSFAHEHGAIIDCYRE